MHKGWGWDDSICDFIKRLHIWSHTQISCSNNDRHKRCFLMGSGWRWWGAEEQRRGEDIQSGSSAVFIYIHFHDQSRHSDWTTTRLRGRPLGGPSNSHSVSGHAEPLFFVWTGRVVAEQQRTTCECYSWSSDGIRRMNIRLPAEPQFNYHGEMVN